MPHLLPRHFIHTRGNVNVNDSYVPVLDERVLTGGDHGVQLGEADDLLLDGVLHGVPAEPALCEDDDDALRDDGPPTTTTSCPICLNGTNLHVDISDKSPTCENTN